MATTLPTDKDYVDVHTGLRLQTLAVAQIAQLVATTMGVTGLTFMGLSWYARSATISLFVTIHNLFTSLLHIFGFLGGEVRNAKRPRLAAGRGQIPAKSGQ